MLNSELRIIGLAQVNFAVRQFDGDLTIITEEGITLLEPRSSFRYAGDSENRKLHCKVSVMKAYAGNK